MTREKEDPVGKPLTLLQLAGRLVDLYLEYGGNLPVYHEETIQGADREVTVSKAVFREAERNEFWEELPDRILLI